MPSVHKHVKHWFTPVQHVLGEPGWRGWGHGWRLDLQRSFWTSTILWFHGQFWHDAFEELRLLLLSIQAVYSVHVGLHLHLTSDWLRSNRENIHRKAMTPVSASIMVKCHSLHANSENTNINLAVINMQASLLNYKGIRESALRLFSYLNKARDYRQDKESTYSQHLLHTVNLTPQLWDKKNCSTMGTWTE